VRVSALARDSPPELEKISASRIKAISFFNCKRLVGLDVEMVSFAAGPDVPN